MRPIDILIDRHLSGATGGLTLLSAEIQKAFIFKNGEITFVQSNLRDETLAALLVEQGRITKEQHLECVKRMLETKKMQGDTLVELGLLSPSEVFEALTMQMREKVKSALKMDNVKYSFVSNVPKDIPTLSIDFFSTVLDGLAENYSPQRFKEESDFKSNHKIRLNEFGEKHVKKIKVRPEIMKLIRSIDGTHTLAEFIQHSNSKRYATALIFLLFKMHLVDFEATTETAPSPETAKPEPPTPSQAEVKTETPPVPVVKNKPKPVVVSTEPVSPPVEKPISKDDKENMYHFLLRLQKMDYFQMLGIPEESSAGSVERAYNLAIKNYKIGHIDANYENEDRNHAHQVLDILTTAKAILMDKEQKKNYLTDLKKHKKKQSAVESPELQAEIACLKIELFIKYQDFDEAIKQAEKAIEQQPKSVQMHILHGQAHFKSSVKKEGKPSKTAEESFRKAMELKPEFFMPYLELGYYYKLSDDANKARQFFNKALDRNPRCRQAETELRLLEKRAEKSKSLFSFGKKN